MLLNFRLKNFKSFVEMSELSMLASSIKEHQSSLLMVNGVRVLPIAAFFGANGCGKSNYIEAFMVMRDLVLGYGKENLHSKLRDLISPFIFNKKFQNMPTEFEISLYDKDGGKEFRYGFSMTKQNVLEEWLFVKTFSRTKNLNEKCVFYREKDAELQSDILNKDKKELEFVHSLTKEDELLMTNLGKRGQSKYSFVYNWMKDRNIWMDYSTDFHAFYDSNQMQSILKILFRNEKYLRETSRLLHNIDSSIQSLSIKKEMDYRMNERFVPYSIHLDDDKKVLELPFTSESCGTRKMLTFAFYLLTALENGFTVFVDELDSKFHPLILRHIVGMFANKETNLGGAQLIFTSHNLICLDSNDLRRDEIWFIEKNYQRSKLFSLYDFKETKVRNDLSFGKNYLNGRFGAVPFAEEKKNGDR